MGDYKEENILKILVWVWGVY